MPKGPATDDQKRLATKLGIEFRPDVPSTQLSSMITTKIERLSLIALRKHPEISTGSLVTYKNDEYVITTVNRKRW